MSGRPGSNWRHSAWKADALPTELLPQKILFILTNKFLSLNLTIKLIKSKRALFLRSKILRNNLDPNKCRFMEMILLTLITLEPLIQIVLSVE